MNAESVKQVSQILALLFAATTLPNMTAGQEVTLFWSVGQGVVIYESALDGSRTTEVLASEGGVVPDIAIDPVELKIYWPSPASGGILRANFDGSDQELVVNTLETPIRIAFDPIHRQIYWTHWSTLDSAGSLWRSNEAGDDREQLLDDITGITAIEVDPEGGYFYWSEFLDGTIQRTTLDNTRTETIFDGGANIFGRTGLPTSLALDPERNRLYFSDTIYRAIVSIGLDGSDPKFLRTTDGKSPLAVVLDPVHERIIWSTSSFPESSVSSVDLNGENFRVDFIPSPLFGLATIEHFAIFVAPVPEPSSAGLAMICCCAILFLRVQLL